MGAYNEIIEQIGPDITLVAVSKTKPTAQILKLYEQGQRDFGENRVQELVEKQEQLPKDIRWHMIGHLQKNKVKYIAPFVHLIHSVDSNDLIDKINREAEKHNRKIAILLQYRISKEETKFGLNKADLFAAAEHCIANCPNIEIKGLMGMASYSSDQNLVKSEFTLLKECFVDLQNGLLSNVPAFKIKSMGMSGDYQLALESGSNMLRIGTLLFGERSSV